MKRMYCLLVTVFMLVTLCGFASPAYAGPCAHDTKEFIMQITEGPQWEGAVHKTYYIDVYVCVFCNETVTDTVAVDVDGHTFVRYAHKHMSNNTHEFYYSCLCDATHTESKPCYGPPCDINYFGLSPDEVEQ